MRCLERDCHFWGFRPLYGVLGMARNVNAVGTGELFWNWGRSYFGFPRRSLWLGRSLDV